MNLLDRLNKYNQKISFNIFALNGYVIFLIFIYWNFVIEPDYSYVALIFIFIAFITSIFLIAFIVHCVEVITQYKLPFGFLKNKLYSFILLFGALISMIYLLLLLSYLVFLLFM